MIILRILKLVRLRGEVKNYAGESKRRFSVGDLIKYWDEFNEVYHIGIIVSRDNTPWVNLDVENFFVFFADTVPGYLQPSQKYGNVLFSCSDSVLEHA